jgi:hypothetical protein
MHAPEHGDRASELEQAAAEACAVLEEVIEHEDGALGARRVR